MHLISNLVEVTDNVVSQEMCSLENDEVNKMCSSESNDTCGDGCFTNKKRINTTEESHVNRNEGKWIRENIRRLEHM